MDTHFIGGAPPNITLGETRAIEREANWQATLQRFAPKTAAALAHLESAKARTHAARETHSELSNAVFRKKNRLQTMPHDSGDRAMVARELTVLIDACDIAEETLQFELEALDAAQRSFESTITVSAPEETL